MLKKLSLIIFLIYIAIVIMTAGVLAAEYDLDGRTVTWGYNHDLEERHFEEPEDVAWLEEVEEEFNVNIEFDTFEPQDADGFVDYLAPQVMAGDPDIDIMIVKDTQMSAAAGEGLIYPVDSQLDEEYWDSVNPQAAKNNHFFKYPGDDKFYGLVGPYAGYNDSQLVVWNKNLFEREGLPNPYELWKDGEWTWDAFKDIAVEATRDTDGDGEIDQRGFGNSRNWSMEFVVSDIITNMIGSNNGNGVVREDSRLQYALDNEPATEALRFLQEIYYEEEAGIFPLHQQYDMVEDPRKEFIAGNLAMIFARDWRLERMQEEMEDDYSLVPLPKGPEAEENKTISTWSWVSVMPVTEEDSDKLVALHNKLWKVTEEYQEESWEEQQQETINEEKAMYVRDEESMDVIEWNMENNWQVLGVNELYIPDLQETVADIIVEGESVSSAVDAIKGPAQEYIDEAYNE